MVHSRLRILKPDNVAPASACEITYLHVLQVPYSMETGLQYSADSLRAVVAAHRESGLLEHFSRVGSDSFQQVRAEDIGEGKNLKEIRKYVCDLFSTLTHVANMLSLHTWL